MFCLLKSWQLILASTFYPDVYCLLDQRDRSSSQTRRSSFEVMFYVLFTHFKHPHCRVRVTAACQKHTALILEHEKWKRR